jgi:hypothetical protein
MKLNGNTLKKLESLFKELGYSVRYGQGNFQSGYCWVNQNKVVVINKFFDTEARIAVLLEILQKEQVSAEAMEEKQVQFFKSLCSLSEGMAGKNQEG